MTFPPQGLRVGWGQVLAMIDRYYGLIDPLEVTRSGRWAMGEVSPGA